MKTPAIRIKPGLWIKDPEDSIDLINIDTIFCERKTNMMSTNISKITGDGHDPNMSYTHTETATYRVVHL